MRRICEIEPDVTGIVARHRHERSDFEASEAVGVAYQDGVANSSYRGTSAHTKTATPPIARMENTKTFAIHCGAVEYLPACRAGTRSERVKTTGANVLITIGTPIRSKENSLCV